MAMKKKLVVKSKVKLEGLGQHNPRRVVRIKTGVRSGGAPGNHNARTAIRIKSKVKAGSIPTNHNGRRFSRFTF